MKHIMQSQAMKKFIRNKRAMTGLAVVALLTLSVLLLPLVLDLAPYTTDREAGFNQPPSAAHIFGTDDVGRDLFARVLYGGRTSLFVGITATIISVLIGIPLGIVAAIRQYHFVDYASLALALVLFSLPSFWFAMMGQILFCLVLNWLPSSGVGSLAHFILPSITLGANILASQLRMTRTSMLDVVKQDYIRTARAKGADERRVVVHHVLRNGMLPVVTQIGISFASCMGGSVITETVFSIPGIGSLLINAVKGRDVPVVMGTLIFIAVFVGVINLIVDIIYALIDPRVKLTA